jgi:hypothetical protein
VKVRILSPAQQDLEQGYQFYDPHSPGLGSYFLDCLYSDLDSLAYLAASTPSSSGITVSSPSGFRSPSTIVSSMMPRFSSLFSIVGAIRAG